MINNKKTFHKIIYAVIIVFVTGFFTLLNTRAYISEISSGLENYVFRCRDFGQYIGELQEYSIEGISLLDTIEVNKEPFLFVIASSLKRISSLEIRESYLIIAILIHILTGLFSYIVTLRITRKKTLGIIIVLFISTSFVANRALDALLTRQALSNMFILGWCTSLIITGKKYTIKNAFFVGLFLAGSLIAHRISFLFSCVGLVSIIGFLLIKGQYQRVKFLLYTALIGFILSGPYITIFIQNFIDYFITKLNTSLSISKGTAEYINSNSSNNSLGVSVVGGDQYGTAIVNYFLNQNFILYIAVASLCKNMHKNMPEQTMFYLIFAISSLYICFKIPFSNRVIITANIFILIFLVLSIYKVIDNKIFRIIAINTIWLLGMLLMVPLTIGINQKLNKGVLNVKNDASVNFIRKNINPKNAFLMGSHCVNDFGVQIGYKTSINAENLTLWKGKDDELDFESMGGKAAALTYGLFEKNYSIEQLKNKDIYILFGPYFGNKQKETLVKIKNHDPFFFSKDYMKLIYENDDSKGLVTYIFKVDNNGLIYSADENYFNRIMGKYNE